MPDALGVTGLSSGRDRHARGTYTVDCVSSVWYHGSTIMLDVCYVVVGAMCTSQRVRLETPQIGLCVAVQVRARRRYSSRLPDTRSFEYTIRTSQFNLLTRLRNISIPNTSNVESG